MKKYYELAHQRLSLVNGPPIVQIFEVFLNAYEAYHGSKSEFLRYQAEGTRNALRIFKPLLETIRNHPPSPAVRQRVTELERRARLLLGPETLPVRIGQKAMSTFFNLRMDHTDSAKLSRTTPDPEVRWTYFNQSSGAEPVIVKRNRSRNLPEAVVTPRKSPFGALRFDPRLLFD
jgi:hypothetical protein